jgi:site-specific DNA-methyltransferase (adenine-specific)
VVTRTPSLEWEPERIPGGWLIGDSTMTPYCEFDGVTIYLGDCREVTEWLAADVLITDPPYGIGWKARYGDARRGTKEQAQSGGVVRGDQDTDARDTALAAWGDRPAMVFGSWRIPRPPAVHAMLIWHKAGAYTGPTVAPFYTNHEEIYVLGKGWPSRCPPLRSVLTTTEHRSQATAAAGHPTPKPVPLMATLIEACPPGVIADPFAGSGATLIAARLNKRRAIGVEVEERYCEDIANRLSQGILL